MPTLCCRRSLLGSSLSLAAALMLGACSIGADSGPLGAGVNMPAVGVTPQAFGFSVQARDFTFQQVYSPLSGDSLGVGLSVAGYGGGSALLEILDSTDAVVFSQQVSQSVAQGQTTVGGVSPYRVRLQFTHFTGVFALGVGQVTH
jgi:hypothetical protein